MNPWLVRLGWAAVTFTIAKCARGEDQVVEGSDGGLDGGSDLGLPPEPDAGPMSDMMVPEPIVRPKIIATFSDRDNQQDLQLGIFRTFDLTKKGYDERAHTPGARAEVFNANYTSTIIVTNSAGQQETEMVQRDQIVFVNRDSGTLECIEPDLTPCSGWSSGSEVTVGARSDPRGLAIVHSSNGLPWFYTFLGERRNSRPELTDSGRGVGNIAVLNPEDGDFIYNINTCSSETGFCQSLAGVMVTVGGVEFLYATNSPAVVQTGQGDVGGLEQIVSTGDGEIVKIDATTDQVVDRITLAGCRVPSSMQEGTGSRVIVGCEGEFLGNDTRATGAGIATVFLSVSEMEMESFTSAPNGGSVRKVRDDYAYLETRDEEHNPEFTLLEVSGGEFGSSVRHTGPLGDFMEVAGQGLVLALRGETPGIKIGDDDQVYALDGEEGTTHAPFSIDYKELSDEM